MESKLGTEMQDPVHSFTVIDDCWNRIGVWSHAESPCPKLQEVVHCHNCQVFAASASKIFERRSLPPNYLDEWYRHYSKPAPDRRISEHSSVLVFRVGCEFLSLPISVIDEICQPEMIHRLPHYATDILKGIVNIHGQLRLCFSMVKLLGIEDFKPDADGKRRIFPRMMVIRRNESRFALLVDEVLGSCRYAQLDLLPVPASLSHALGKLVRGILQDGGQSIGLLDEELMFHAMEKTLK